MSRSPDLSYYTELRHPGEAEEIIARFASASRLLLGRLAEDLRREADGQFAEPDPRLAPTAAAVERATQHVDAFESIALASTEDPERDRMVRNVVANVVADAGLAEAAEAHAEAPRAREGKFDQQKGGALAGIIEKYGDKIEKIAELVGLGDVLSLIGLIAKDIGFPGTQAEELSLAEVGRQLEAKLDFVIPELGAIKAGGQTIEGIVREDASRGRRIEREIDRIESKADTLADLLGSTLVGEGWVVDPRSTGRNRVPDRDVKQELHDLEDVIRHIDEKLDGPPPEDGNGQPPQDRPRGERRRPVVLDQRLKKIFVYAENVFAAAERGDRRRIRVRTPAFDLSGWLDLTRLRAGDEAEVQVRVSFAGRRDVLFARTRFDQPRLVAFAEFARGQQHVPGSNVLIVLRQTASADDYATPVELAYQFVVESQ